jgi:hypothetical protein
MTVGVEQLGRHVRGRGRAAADCTSGRSTHAGLHLLGRIDETLAAFPGDALVRQDPVLSQLEPQARSGLLRTVVFIALSALGLAALSGAAADR